MNTPTMPVVPRLFFCNCKNKLSGGMQYRFDFFAGIVMSLLASVVIALVQLLFYNGVNGFPGWNISQVILFQGLLLMWTGVRDTLFGSVVKNVEGMIGSGTFDRLLLSPVSVLPAILSSGFNYFGIGTLLAGIAVTVYAGMWLKLTLTFSVFMLLLLFLFSGLVFYTGILTFYCAIVIQLVSTGRLGEILDKLMLFSQYPLQIYSKSLRWVFIFLVPFSLWAYCPAQTLLCRFDWTAFISAAVGFAFFAVAVAAFQFSLKKYASAGG